MDNQNGSEDDKTVVSTAAGTEYILEIVLTKDTKTGVTSIIIGDKVYNLSGRDARIMEEWLMEELGGFLVEE